MHVKRAYYHNHILLTRAQTDQYSNIQTDYLVYHYLDILKYQLFVAVCSGVYWIK